MKPFNSTRRDFIRQTGSAAVALGAFGAQARRVLGANDRISVALIGCGGRGIDWIATEISKLKEIENVDITAVCDVWKRNREAAVTRVKEWFGTEPRAFARYAEVLQLPDIHAVGIATPDHAHSKILADAARAHKDAYCEKPMASNLRDAKDALHAVNENKVICQIGVQRRSDGLHRAAAELIQSGVLGTISEVETAWHDASPRWMKTDLSAIQPDEVDWEQYLMDAPKRDFDPMRFRCWHLWKDYTVGTPGLLGSHLIDAATWFVNDPLPLRAIAHGGIYVWKDGREHADTLDCILEYPKGFILNYSTRLGNNYPKPEVTLYGTKGTFDTASWTVTGLGGGKQKLDSPIKVEPKISENHVQNWLQCIRTRKQPNAPVEVGYAHSVAGILCFLSWDKGQRFAYDAAKEDIVSELV